MQALRIAALALAAAVLCTPTTAAVRFLVDTEDVLAGDWAFGFSPGFYDFTHRAPRNFDRLPFTPDPDAPDGDGHASRIEAGFARALDAYPTIRTVFTTTEFPAFAPGARPPYAGYGELYWSEAYPWGPAPQPPSTGTYLNARQGPAAPVDFAIYDIVIDDTDLSAAVFSGRFCLAARGAVADGVSPASCDRVIGAARATVPVPGALTLGVSGLALLAGLAGLRRRR